MKKKVFFAGMAAMVLSFGLTMAGCDNGTNNDSTGLTAPSAPSEVTATALSDVSISISWNAVYGATGYKVYYESGSSKSEQTQIYDGTTSYTDTWLSDGETYSYSVTAINSAGESDFSESASSTTPMATSVPPAPLELRASYKGLLDGISISWWREQRATRGYNLYYSETSANGPYKKIQIVGQNDAFTNSATIKSGFSMFKTYYFKVSAVNSYGESDLSYNTSVTTKM
ncbi:MAG: hypothetical protein Ta2G_01440 [Termitinemataceae bacterium]|nr:MAG: hypothetical protein Ta2G_01440 [Termitinemataceae bacterium]